MNSQQTSSQNWRYFKDKIWWNAAGRYVLAERVLPDGTLEHLVDGGTQLQPEWPMIQPDAQVRPRFNPS